MTDETIQSERSVMMPEIHLITQQAKPSLQGMDGVSRQAVTLIIKKLWVMLIVKAIHTGNENEVSEIVFVNLTEVWYN